MLPLPASLLLFILTYPTRSPAAEAPRSADGRLLRRYFPSERAASTNAPRTDGEQTLQQPLAVRKMTPDEGEMFFPDYWRFHTDASPDTLFSDRKHTSRKEAVAAQIRNDGARGELGNATILTPARAPFALHGPQEGKSQHSIPNYLRFPRALFSPSKRDFQCPDDTTACTNIDRPGSCCQNGLTCQSIPDSGSGDVGCCIEGQTCSEEVGACEDGYASCPGSEGGGCCVPGYSCVSGGCVVRSTETVVVNPTVTASPRTSSSTSSSSSSFEPLSTSTQTDTTSTTSTVTASPSPSSTFSASSTSPESTSSSEEETPTPVPVAPVRPTSGEASTSTTTTATPTTVDPSFCPTGFYACSAYYHGGCCRTGRDCSDTSCPPVSSSVALNSNGVSVGVPAATTGPDLGEGGCAQGWFTCGADGGGGCCPGGYACGESCTATGVNIGGGVTGTATVAKNNRAGREDVGHASLMLASLTSLMMMIECLS